MRVFSTGSIISFYYANWKTNTKIYAFILYSGGRHVHALNLGAKNLNIRDRQKLIGIIAKLAKVPAANKYSGRILYRLFKTYAPRALGKCYRTYYNNGYIQRPAIINYGLNDSSIADKMNFFEGTYQQAKRDLIVKYLNLFTRRGAKLEDLKKTFAKPVVAKPMKPGATTKIGDEDDEGINKTNIDSKDIGVNKTDIDNKDTSGGDSNIDEDDGGGYF